MSIELFKPYVDFVFKGLFKNSPNALKDFIAAIQGWDPQRIQSLQYLDQALHKQDNAGKAGAVDLLVQLDSGEKIHFEVQVVYQEFYPERSLYYASRIYGEQLNRAESYAELQPLVCIHILLFNLFEDNSALRSFMLLNQKTYEPLTQHLNLIFLEIKKIQQDNTLREELKDWMEFMQEPTAHRQELEKRKAFQEAYEELERLSKDPTQRFTYFCAFKRLKDEEFREIQGKILEERALERGMTEGREQGMAQGKAEGIAQGKAEGEMESKREIIKNLHSMGMPVEKIAQAVGLDCEEIHQYLQSHC